MLNLTDDQVKVLEVSDVQVQALVTFWLLFPENSFESAVGGVKTLLDGRGQKRSARFSDEPTDPSEDFLAASESAGDEEEIQEKSSEEDTSTE